MKFADSIVKVYATSLAMFLTMMVSLWLFDFQLTLQLLLGILSASSSLQLYYMRPQDMLPKDVLHTLPGYRPVPEQGPSRM